ncbi:MAG: AAA family ATPase [Sphingomonadales bacterium]|nr:AAA family ATPase [Sphingomonadales bacterium]MDE2567728.1 AAA family ATPase [Sphingomonadales bacterium]
MPDIFVSYSRSDLTVARRYADRFVEAGMDVWWDVALHSGETYDKVTEDALRNAGAVVVLWSPRSVDSRWVRAEATLADRNKTLMPAMIELCERPIMFELVHTADLSHWTGNADDAKWQAFLSDVRSKVERSGGHVRRPSSSEVTTTETKGAAPGGERRRVTVVSCNFTLSGDAAQDPEDRIELVESAHRALSQAMAPFGGRMIESVTESFTTLFGLLHAHEDDAVLAVDAALAGKDIIARLSARTGQEIHLRCGIRTGTVIIDNENSKPLGGAIDEARRLEMRAGHGEVLICPVTANLVDGFFPLSQTEEGATRVEGPHSAETRFELSRSRGLTAFVGRENEFASLREACDAAARGEGRVVGLVAEAGSGKSRLCHEFKQECRRSGMRVIEGSARSNAGNVPMRAVLELFRNFFELSGEEEPGKARERIGDWTANHEPKLESALPLLFEFLSITEEGAEPSGIDPQVRQRQLVGMFRHLVGLVSQDAPALVLVEDLHWLDESSGQFLEALVEAQSRSRSLLLLNYRPEFRAPWMQASHCRQIALQPLGSDDVGSLLANLVGADPSTGALRAPILERTKGNPFFIEEIVRTLVETGQLTGEKGAYRLAGDVDHLGVPDTVKSVLAARIDRLAPQDKAVLQAASVIGKDFEEPALGKICGLTVAELGDALAKLQRSEFIEETDVFPVSRFTFRHPLVVETALGSLLRKRRRELHSKVAAMLEQSDSKQLDEKAGLIAHHWEEADEKIKAATWYARAARWVTLTNQLASNSSWSKVRELIGAEPATEEAIGLKLEAIMQLLNLNFRVSVNLDLAKTLLAEGQAIADKIGNEGLKLQLSILFSRILCGAGDLDGYLRNARANLAKADEAGDPGLIMVARVMLLDACIYSCFYDEVIESSSQWAKDYPKDLPREKWASGVNPYTFHRFMVAASYGWTGRYAESLAEFENVIALVKDDGTLEVIGWINFCKCIFALSEDDHELAAASEADLKKLCEETGGPLNTAHLHLVQSALATYEKRYDDAIEVARRAEDFFSRLDRQWEGFAIMLHAGALLGKGHYNEAFAKAEQAYAVACRCNVKPIIACSLAQRAHAMVLRDGEAALPAAGKEIAKAAQIIQDSGSFAYRGDVVRAQKALAEFGMSASA